MSARNYIFLIATGFIFFSIALADLLIHNPNVTYNWWSVLHWYGKMSTVCFAIIVLVLFLSPLFKSKK